MSVNDLLFETSSMGIKIQVFADRIEYKRGWLAPVDTIPMSQIASVTMDGPLLNRVFVETTGGHRFPLVTGKKRQLCDAISQARAALRASPAPAPAPTGIADEIAKLAQLRAQKLITDEEFEREKQRLLGR